MKHILYLSVLVFAIYSCKKEITKQTDSYLEKVKASLKDNVSQALYNELDFDRSVLSIVDSSQLYFLRIPFKDKKLEQSFVILKTDSDSQIEQGKIVYMEGTELEQGEGKVKARVFNGSISIQSLNERDQVNSKISSGYIEAYQHQNRATKTMLKAKEDVLPEVVVIAHVNTGGGVSYSEWISLMSFFPDTGGGGGYYGSMNGVGGGGYSGGSGGYCTPKSTVHQDPPIHIDIETYVKHPAIDLEKYLKCFDNIPDAGSTCSIELFCDIPVDSDPNKLFDLHTQSPGHTFIQIKKSNGVQHVMQNIGFYPVTDWQSIITTAPVNGKFVDDGNHEFNASIKMSITPANFKSILTEIRYLARFIKYDVDEYNCTDFAMDVFNKIRSNKLEVPMIHIPGGIAPSGTRTPQGLYLKLQQMKRAGDVEAANITIGSFKNWVADSDGPCY